MKAQDIPGVPDSEDAAGPPRGHNSWAAMSISEAVFFAFALGGLLATLVLGIPLMAAGTQGAWALVPLIGWPVASLGLFGLWLRWPRRRQEAERRAAELRRRGWTRWTEQIIFWSEVPVLLMPIFIAIASFIVSAVLLFALIPFSAGREAAAAVWYGMLLVVGTVLFGLWLRWPRRRRVAARRREVRRRYRAIRAIRRSTQEPR